MIARKIGSGLSLSCRLIKRVSRATAGLYEQPGWHAERGWISLLRRKKKEREKIKWL